MSHQNRRVDEFSTAYDAWAGRQGTQSSGRVPANRSAPAHGADNVTGTVGGGPRGRPAAAAVRTLLEQARRSAERERAESADYSDMPDLVDGVHCSLIWLSRCPDRDDSPGRADGTGVLLWPTAVP